MIEVILTLIVSFFRHSLAVCVVAGTSLYAIGGHDGWSYLTSVERFDTTADLSDRDSWSNVPCMKAARANCGAAAINDKCASF